MIIINKVLQSSSTSLNTRTQSNIFKFVRKIIFKLIISYIFKPSVICVGKIKTSLGS